MAKKKKRKLKKKKLFLFFCFVTVILLCLAFMMDVRINNVIVKGNILYEDYDIIKKAHLDDYPSSLRNSSFKIKRSLEKDYYIKKANVYKTSLTKVVIDVEENLPLFYYLPTKKTILMDRSETNDAFPVPTIINYVPDKIYELLLDKIVGVNYDILKRISEIKYDPNDVDNERFLFYMNDGNMVYVTLSKINKVNSYPSITKTIENKKGVLYLDYGNYFVPIE